VPGGTTGHPIFGVYKYGDLALQAEVLPNLRDQSRVTSPALARASSNFRRQTHPLVEDVTKDLTASVQLKKKMVVGLRGLVAKTK
jgi:hypothetical protein